MSARSYHLLQVAALVLLALIPLAFGLVGLDDPGVLRGFSAVVALGTLLTVGLGLGIRWGAQQAAKQGLLDLTHQIRTLDLDHSDRVAIVGGNAEQSAVGEAVGDLVRQVRDSLTAIRTERDRLQTVLARMTDGVVLVDTSERVLLVNNAARRIFRSTVTSSQPARLNGPTLIELTRDHHFREILAAAEANGGSRVELMRYGAPDRFLRVTAAPLHDLDETVSLLVIQDISEVRRAEAIRREFIANVSHELRTPIASIKALAETLEDNALDDPPAARDFLSRMHVEVDALAQLVHELLELSRLESGQTALQPRPTPPLDLVLPAIGRLKAQADRAGLRLESIVPEGLPPVLVDSERLLVVLMNLIHNAIKFTPVGGTIFVEVEQLGDEPAMLTFRVRDTGPGIPPDDLPRLFERFYKVDKSRATSGTGLGLAVAKHIVQAHGGRIWAESTEGQGATFSLTIPIARGPVSLHAIAL